MELILAIISVIAGLVFLAKGGDFLVNSAVSFAKKHHLPEVFIGIVLVGFGTSLPEVVTTINAVLKGQGSLALGTLVGSNTANILFILAMGLILCKNLPARQLTSEKLNYFMTLGGTAVFAALAFFFITLTIPLAIFMLLLLAGALVLSVKFSGHHPAEEEEFLSQLKTILFALMGFAGLFVGADLLVKGAVTLAQHFGVKEQIIGLTLVAFGTSLPELFATIAAAKKRKIGLVAGNILGSNLFNLLGAASVGAFFGALNTKPLWADIGLMLATTLIILPLFYAKKMPWKLFGVGLLCLYVAYVTYLATHA